MTEHVDRIPPLQLTLEDSLRITVAGRERWAPVLGLVRTGELVVVTCAGLDTALGLAENVPVVVLRSSDAAESDEADLDDLMAGWYAGDVGSAGAAVDQHAQDSGVGVGAAAGASALERDPSLVGIYGGDLEHIRDVIGARGAADQAADDDARARRAVEERRMAAAARGVGAPQPGEPETDEITEAVEARMAGWYAGDVEALVEHPEP